MATSKKYLYWTFLNLPAWDHILHYLCPCPGCCRQIGLIQVANTNAVWLLKSFNIKYINEKQSEYRHKFHSVSQDVAAKFSKVNKHIIVSFNVFQFKNCICCFTPNIFRNINLHQEHVTLTYCWKLNIAYKTVNTSKFVTLDGK